MTKSRPVDETDLRIRHFVYRFFVDHTRPPTAGETSTVLCLEESEVQARYQRLHHHHFFFLEPGTLSIRIANPLSAIPTPFRVHVSGKSYWANCAWDMLGVAAMLPTATTIQAVYQDTGETTEVVIQDGRLRHQGGVIHFPLPVRRWYDDLILT